MRRSSTLMRMERSISSMESKTVMATTKSKDSITTSSRTPSFSRHSVSIPAHPAIRQKGKYGDVIYGANYRFVKTESFSTNLVLGGSQLTQSAYNALQMPYCLFGIGRSKDYIKSFRVALVAGGDIRVKNYSPIIPNSQLIITATGTDTSRQDTV